MSRLETFLDAMRPLLEEQGAHGAWLFGSHARGTARAGSDIDLIVVQSSDEPRPDRRQFYGPAVRKAGGAVDLLVYTPEEFEAMKAQERPFVINALMEAKQIHAGTAWAVELESELEELRGGAAWSGPAPPEKAWAEAERWLDQAEYDLGFARLALREEYFSQACFVSQQAAEKAVKAIVYGSGERLVRGHSIVEIVEHFADRVPELKALREQGDSLDEHYIASRYPNGVAEGPPFAIYDRPKAEEAMEAAEQIVAVAAARIRRSGGEV
jgi:HEPN domain-containing protein/predicted nucleotidyltransferase